jgi:hypothetical protein
LQALNLMNDETYVEASRFLAARMMRSSDATAARLAFGFRTVLARTPKPTEIAILDRAYRRAFEDFTRDPAAAKAFLSIGDTPSDSQLNPIELAAFATVASTLLCMDETVTKP